MIAHMIAHMRIHIAWMRYRKTYILLYIYKNSLYAYILHYFIVRIFLYSFWYNLCIFGTKLELCKLYNLNKLSVINLINGMRSEYNGWRILR